MRKRSSYVLFQSFTPSQYPDLLGYWLANDARGSYVGLWSDNSGNGHTLTSSNQGTAGQYNATSIDGLSGVNFVSTDFLKASTVTPWKVLHEGPCTVIVVVKPTNASTGRTVFDTSLTTGIGTNLVHNGDTNRFVGTIRNGTGIIATLTSPANYPEGNVYTVSITFDGTTATLRVNQVTVAQVTVSDVPSSADPASPLTLGARGDGTFNLFGDIRTFIIYSSVLSQSNLQVAEAGAKNLQTKRRQRKIWTIGDSTSDLTWQRNMWRAIQETSDNFVELVGTQTTFNSPVDPFPMSDRAHTGIQGGTMNDILSVVNGVTIDGLTDIILMTGTNDTKGGAFNSTTQTNYLNLFNTLKNQHPGVTMWCPRLYRQLGLGATATEDMATWLSTTVPSLGGNYINIGNSTPMADNLHPTVTGYDDSGTVIGLAAQ